MSHWANSDGSVFVLGRTQTGKTTTVRELHRESKHISIWVNRRGKDRIRNVHGNRYQSVTGIKNGLSRNERKFNLLSGDPAGDITALIAFLWEAAERVDRELPFQVVVDELHTVAPQSQKDALEPRDSLRKVAREGQKRRIRLVGITQDPVSMDKQTLRQREYLLVFDLSAEQARYIADYGVDVDTVRSQGDYAGVLYHASGEELQTGVKAKGKYA